VLRVLTKIHDISSSSSSTSSFYTQLNASKQPDKNTCQRVVPVTAKCGVARYSAASANAHNYDGGPVAIFSSKRWAMVPNEPEQSNEHNGAR